MTRDEILCMEAEKVNKLVCMFMETMPGGKTIAELRNNYFDWRYSTFSAVSPHEWWKAEIGTDINLIDGQFDKKYDDFMPHWIPNKFPAYAIAQAWEVVEKLREKYHFTLSDDTTAEIGAHWVAHFYTNRVSAFSSGDSYCSRAETAPLAICRAALLAAMNE